MIIIRQRRLTEQSITRITKTEKAWLSKDYLDYEILIKDNNENRNKHS